MASPPTCRQLPGSGIGLPDFWGPLALNRHQGRAQGGLQAQLVLGTLSRIRQGCEYFEPPGEMAQRFHMRRALDRTLASLLPVYDRLRVEARLGIVVRQQFGLGSRVSGNRVSNTCAMR